MLNLLLLFCFISYSETPEIPPKHVEGKKGGNVTLPCDYQAKEISDIRFIRYNNSTHFSEIPVCQNKEYKHESGRVCTKGACAIFLKDLNFSDPGTYLLRFDYENYQIELKYHLLIHDSISVKAGDKLKLDYLLINAEQVMLHSSGGYKKVWSITDGVQNDRVTVEERNLIINNFTSNDAGTYEALDSIGEILIKVTVTESGTGSNEKLNTDDDKPNDTEQRTVEPWIIGLSVSAALVLVLVISALIWKYKCQNRNIEHEPVPMQDIVVQNI